jgi:hypothetical protein
VVWFRRPDAVVPRVRVNGSDATATLMARLKQDRADKS